METMINTKGCTVKGVGNEVLAKRKKLAEIMMNFFFLENWSLGEGNCSPTAPSNKTGGYTLFLLICIISLMIGVTTHLHT